MKRFRLILLIILAFTLIFPGVIATQGNVIFTADRVSNVNVTPENEGILGIQGSGSIEIDSNSERLVKIQNQLNINQNVTVSLENGIDWSFGGGVKEESKTIAPSNNESYFIETEGVTASTGEYTIQSRDGSFLFETNRSVNFESTTSSLTATVGGNSGKALLDSADTDGEPLKVDGEFIFPSGLYTYSSNDTSVATVNETANCSGAEQNSGECAVYVDPVSKGDVAITVSDGSGNSDTVIVRVTESPFFAEIVKIQEPIEGEGLVKVNVQVENNGSQTRSTDVRVDPEFTSPKTKTYSGIGSSSEDTRTFEFSTQQGDNGTYTATAETFEVDDVGGRTIDTDKRNLQIFESGPGLEVSGVTLINSAGVVNESETMEFRITVENQDTSSVTDNVSIRNSTVGSNRTSVTVGSGETKDVLLNIDTNVGDRGQYIFTTSTSSSSSNPSFTIERSVPFISSFGITGINSDNRVAHKFKSSTVNDANITDVRLNVSVNGTQQESVLLVDDGTATGNQDGGTIDLQQQQIQTQNDIEINVGFNLSKGGNKIKSTLIVKQSDGFEKVNTTQFSN